MTSPDAEARPAPAAGPPAPARDTAPEPAHGAAPAPAAPEPVLPEPVLPEQSREDTDAAWGEYQERDDDRLYRDRPPHWADY
jgi:hypothetical protein